MKIISSTKLLSFVGICLYLIFLVGCKAEVENAEVEQWKAQAERVTIYRDNYGVPHIYGKTDADAVFGLLYAQCEDDFNRVEQNYIWATGRLAEIEGEEAIYSDVRANLFMTIEEAKAHYEKAPDWLKKLCVAFADGINYYLHTHPEVKPRLLTRFEPWMPLFFSEGSIGGDIERVRIKGIKDFYETREWPAKSTLKELEPDPEMAEPQGSNGIAISGELTESGNPLLLINPHTSFYFRGEVHVVSEEGLNAYGAVTWGQFFVYQGFNEKTGWMHTSTYTDVIDDYRESITDVNGQLFYQYGEELRPVDSLKVNLSYKDGNQLANRDFTLYRTHHGPITKQIDGQWTSTAMMWEPVTTLEQSFIRTKQEGYKGFRKMMDLRTNSSNNTVYADAEGNIAYFHGNFVPKRDDSFDFTKPLDGTDPKTDWNGLHSVEENILVLNPPNGWIQNCNSTPYTSAAENSPKREDYPKYMSRDQENFRGVHAIELLTDKNGFTLDGLIDLAHDPYLPAFKAMIPGLVNAGKSSGNKDIEEAIQVLEAWDYRTSTESVGMTLAHYYGMAMFDKAHRPEGMYAMQLMNYWGRDSDPKERVVVFREVINQLNTDFGTWKMPWGEVNRYQRLNGDIRQAFDDNQPSTPIGFASGRWGALAAYGARYHNNTKKIYGTRGNSFVAVVEFGDKVKAKTVLAGGQSGDPSSPHFNDQLSLYANKQWKEVPYYKEDVLKAAIKQYHPGQEE